MNFAQRLDISTIIIFSIVGLIFGYLLFATFHEEVSPTSDIYYKYEDPMLTKIREAATKKNQLLLVESDIYFNTSSSEILDSSVIMYVAAHNLAKIVFVKGHTDNSGLEATNLKLSNRRANVVCDLLVKYGCLGSISGEGYGAKNPKALNDVESNKKYNRRTEIFWKKKQ
jgi:outer membrane protein OmpA-like peptidoglycan-associated protein